MAQRRRSTEFDPIQGEDTGSSGTGSPVIAAQGGVSPPAGGTPNLPTDPTPPLPSLPTPPIDFPYPVGPPEPAGESAESLAARRAERSAALAARRAARSAARRASPVDTGPPTNATPTRPAAPTPVVESGGNFAISQAPLEAPTPVSLTQPGGPATDDPAGSSVAALDITQRKAPSIFESQASFNLGGNPLDDLLQGNFRTRSDANESAEVSPLIQQLLQLIGR